jgi:hypothetical protein
MVRDGPSCDRIRTVVQTGGPGRPSHVAGGAARSHLCRAMTAQGCDFAAAVGRRSALRPAPPAGGRAARTAAPSLCCVPTRLWRHDRRRLHQRRAGVSSSPAHATRGSPSRPIEPERRSSARSAGKSPSCRGAPPHQPRPYWKARLAQTTCSRDWRRARMSRWAHLRCQAGRPLRPPRSTTSCGCRRWTSTRSLPKHAQCPPARRKPVQAVASRCPRA